MDRRSFLRRSALAGGLTLLAPRALAADANSELRVAVIGIRSRGRNHIDSVIATKGARLVAVCDVDPAELRKCANDLDKKGVKVATFSDFRKVCDSPDIDAISIATPNHTHCLIAITAAASGKHVYVEKPVSHNVWEGRQLANAQEKHGVIIQHGFQRRSETAWHDAFEWIKEGNLGALVLARGLCYKPRPSIGRANGAQLAPEGLDYNLWCGPRPLQPITRKQFHYDWHWQFAWGNGDLGNQGPHQLDVCRWALGDPAELPRSVFSCGNRFAHDDDGQWANTQVVGLDYEKAPIIFEVRGLPQKNVDYSSGMDSYRGQAIGNVIEYEGGSLVGGHNAGCVVLDSQGKEIRKFSGGRSHFQTWIDSIQSGKQDPACSAASGHLSSALAHIGNISWQLGAPMNAAEAEAAIPGEALLESFGRMKSHLAANGIDLAKTPVNIGPRLEIASGAEAFTGTHAEHANNLLKGDYRAEFALPS